MTTTTETALLRAIAAHPDEDTPRLMYADWLEENDQPERAEFIRLQIWISQQQHPHDACPGCGYEPADGYHHNSPDCPYVRVSELWHGGIGDQFVTGDISASLCSPLPDFAERHPVLVVARGFAETLYLPTLADLCERGRVTCDSCAGRRRIFTEAAHRPVYQIANTRQFVMPIGEPIEIECPTCEGRGYTEDYTGKPTKLALDVMRAHPTITRVVVGDRRPDEDWCEELKRPVYCWQTPASGDSFVSDYELPAIIYRELPMVGDFSKSFDTARDALDALAVAAGQWLRSRLHKGEHSEG